AFHIWIYRLDEMALDAADPFERQVPGDDLLDHGIDQVREHERLGRVAVQAIALEDRPPRRRNDRRARGRRRTAVADGRHAGWIDAPAMPARWSARWRGAYVIIVPGAEFAGVPGRSSLGVG